MQHQKDRKRSRWDHPNQQIAWPPLQHPELQSGWGQGSGPWYTPHPPIPTLHPPPPHHPPPHHPPPHHPPPHHHHPPPHPHHLPIPPYPNYPGFDQFSAAYHSDRFDGRNYFQHPYQSPFWSGYGNTVQQPAYHQNGHHNFQGDGQPGNTMENGRTSVSFNGEESDNCNPTVNLDPLVCPGVQSSVTETVKDPGASHTGAKPQKDRTQKKAIDKDTSSKVAHSQNKKKKKEKKGSSHISPSKTLHPSGRGKSKLSNAHKKSPLKQRCRRGSGIQQKGCENSERFPLSVRRSPHNGNGLLSRATVPGDRGGQKGSGVSGKGAQNGIGYLGRSPMPVGRGRLNGRPPQPFGRGARNLFGRTAENYQRYGSQVYDDDKDDESNEIHHWLVNSKGEERKPDNDSVNKDPLPGSEEARTNAIKEAADRLKQALKTKKNVNLNKLLSSGEESKSDNQAQKVLKTCPKNLAQLELDASDMRAIGRANTEKTNCHAEDDSDDDIIEVQRPPSPVHQVIDLEPSKLFHGSSSSSDNNHSDDDDDDDVDDSDDDVPLGKRLGHVQNLSLDEHDLLSLSLGITSNPALDEDDVPLRTRLKHVQHLTCTDKTRQADSNTREEDNLPGPSSMEESERPTNSCNVNHCELIRHELSVSQKNSSKIMSPKIDSAHSIVNVESNDEISTHSPESSVQPQSTFSPRVACRGGRSPNKKRPSMHYPLSPAPNLDQRRRRSSSSSSLCESTTTPGAHTGLSNSPDSVDSTFKRNYDSKQRKIISDLKKINQSKLKDLVNNPRSGKLDFAMKQLMKEHRSILSKMSREVAERRIPAEYLNPKSTELPPDDSTLLADFAIDWSSLPGELISTLGDLFYDCNSETPMNICESQHNMTREPCDSPDIELLFPDKGSFPDRNDDQIGDDGLVLAPAISKDASNSVRIRVCQFAREELCLPSENDETCTLENNFEQSSPSTLPALINTETDLLVGEKQAQMGNSDLSRPNESRTNCKTREANSNQTNYPNPLCVTPRSLEDFDRPTREPLNMEVDGSVTETEPLQSIDNISVNSSSTGAVKAISNKIKPGKLKQKKKKKKAKQQMLLKKKKFVRLEERSWFVESVCSTKSNLSFKSKTKQITHSNPSPQNDDGTVQITETVSSENIADENSREQIGFMENVNQRNLPHDNPSCSIESSNIAAVQNQCVSMLPVLMMTVPANETSSEISNLTVPEMQKRIEEIDRMLQDLVQERCCLSQSLKAALAVDNCQNTAVMQSAQQSSGQDDVAQINVNEISVVPYHSAIENCGETSKRKCSSNDEDKTSQRVCHDDFESMQSIANSSLNVQGSVSNVDCAENDGSVQPDQVKSNNSPRNHKNSQRKDSVTSYSSDVDFELDIDHFLNNPPFDYHCLKEVQGLIYHVKTCNSSIFAASENGLVYWIIDNEPRYLQGYFGEKTEVSVKSLEIIESCLYAVDYSGQLRIYDIPDLLPNCYLNPKPKHVFTLGITIFTTVFDWDRVYCGSSEGSVIPFNTKSFLVEEKLFDVGHPILSMTTKTDCGKRFLIVACRRHPTEIRDAESGLLIRSFGGSEWTVYTVISYDNLVYCGANKNKVLVFWFKDGKKCTELVAGTGIINMKLYNNYLVCGCHDGKIYVFNLRFHQLISTLSGPGGIIYTITFNRQKMLCSTQKKSLVCITATYPPEKPNSPEKDQDDVYVVSEQTEHKASEISNHEEGKVCTLSKDLSLGNYVCRNDLEGNILAIKIGGDSDLFAASSNGLVYWFRGRNWKEQVHTTFGKIRPNGSLGAVTCLEVVKSSLYTGSEDGILCIYSIPFKPGGTEIVEPTLTYNISNGIQCMEACWNFIYIGTKVGSVIPYSLDAKEVGEPLSSGDHPILCIKTHKEGPRRVLIVASRQQNIAIRDALSGLLLRSFGNCSSELTVYSVLCHNNLVYCGSNTNNILVYDFQSGEPKFKLDAGQGITAMKVFNDHLFCGCYDGKIYVFNLKTHIRVCSVNGPGNMILALDFMGKSMLCSSKGCLLTKYKHPLYTYFKDSIKMAK